MAVNGAITKMEDYRSDFRPLDCWDCFEAQGKMCHNRDASKHKKLLGKNNLYMGICCKPDSTDEECVNDLEHICSSPAHDPDPLSSTRK